MSGLLGLLAITGLAVWALFYQRPLTEEVSSHSTEVTSQLDKLWRIAQTSMREKKYLRAEKALLTILRIDERNPLAYNHLGILYAKQHAYDDAIECFEIAQSLEPSPSSLHNVGLIYYETGNYEKAALAFEQALELENQLAARHIAYAKVQEKLGDHKKMISALERAVELEPNPQSLGILADAYERDGQHDLANDIREKAKTMLSVAATPEQPRTVQQPRKVVM